MLFDLVRARLDLCRNQLVRLTDARGTRVDCVAGSVWITVDGELRDVVLSPGGSFVVDSRAPVLVHAVDDATTVALQAPRSARRARPASPGRGWRASPAPFAAAA